MVVGKVIKHRNTNKLECQIVAQEEENMWGIDTSRFCTALWWQINEDVLNFYGENKKEKRWKTNVEH